MNQRNSTALSEGQNPNTTDLDRQFDLLRSCNTPPYAILSKTSKAAAERIKPRVAGGLKIVFQYLESCGLRGATDEEVREATGLGENTARPRRIGLRDRGLVVDSGKTRLTKAGRHATVWVVANPTQRTLM